jgi:maltooligosyltrehalose trehalohydrolase
VPPALVAGWPETENVFVGVLGGPGLSDVGVVPAGHGMDVRVFASRPRRVWIELLAGDGSGARIAERHLLDDRGGGLKATHLAALARPGTLYRFALEMPDGRMLLRPDPASRFQPDGVHAPSAIVDPRAFAFRAPNPPLPPLEDLVLYELHVGTFTDRGTFEAATAALPALRHELGVNAVELMPVAAFPGNRGWGYDGVDLYAPHAAYGGPEGLWRFVDACHSEGLAVVLDVVYNHFGPEGCYLRDFGDYFLDGEHTPWGDALRLHGPGSEAVRQFLCGNAAMWVRDYRVDGLRLDAVHAFSEAVRLPLCAQIARAAREAAATAGRQVWVIGESDLNDPRLCERGGGELDAVWSDDLHHALHASLTGERDGYYADFPRGATDVGAALERGFVYVGQRSAYRGRSHGRDGSALEGRQLIVSAQNHDQVGNRPRGERIHHQVGIERAKVMAVAVLLAAPNVPLLFMGEEYAEDAPFLYFTGFGDPDLARAVREGRLREMGPGASDPQDRQTFDRSRLDRTLRHRGLHEGIYRLYRDALALRRAHPDLAARHKAALRADVVQAGKGLVVRRPCEGRLAVIVLGLGAPAGRVRTRLPPGEYRCALHTAWARYGGPGAAGADGTLFVGDESETEVAMTGEGAAVFLS